MICFVYQGFSDDAVRMFANPLDAANDHHPGIAVPLLYGHDLTHSSDGHSHLAAAADPLHPLQHSDLDHRSHISAAEVYRSCLTVHDHLKRDDAATPPLSDSRE
jgi:hypothetical protein